MPPLEESLRARRRPASPAFQHFVLAVLLLAGIAPIHADERIANAPTAPTAGGDGGKRYGTVWRVGGDVFASSLARGTTRTLKLNDTVYVGEHIRAGSVGEAVLLTDDAGLIAVRSNSELVAESYVAEARKTDHISVRLLKGTLRMISGWVSLIHRDGVEIVMPTATIGIRGTDHEPFVLADEAAESTPYDAGSYDKVNRGRTVLKNATGEVEIDAGRAGFAPAPNAKQPADIERGLITLLLPVLLDKVPGFYTAGRFEHDLDEYSQKADQILQQRLDVARAGQAAAAETTCAAQTIAKEWIGKFDAAIQRHDADAVLALFARDASVEATVRNAKGETVKNTFTRKQFARSARTAVQELTDYQQRRETLDAAIDPAAEAAACSRLRLKSFVVEQGKLAGRPYHVESDEEYVLEKREGGWLAVLAITTQR